MALTYFRFLPSFLVVYIMHAKNWGGSCIGRRLCALRLEAQSFEIPWPVCITLVLSLVLRCSEKWEGATSGFSSAWEQVYLQILGLLAKFSGLHLKYRGCVVLASLAVCVYKHSTCTRTHTYSLIHSLRSLGGEKTLTTQTWPEKPVN